MYIQCEDNYERKILRDILLSFNQMIDYLDIMPGYIYYFENGKLVEKNVYSFDKIKFHYFVDNIYTVKKYMTELNMIKSICNLQEKYNELNGKINLIESKLNAQLSSPQPKVEEVIKEEPKVKKTSPQPKVIFKIGNIVCSKKDKTKQGKIVKINQGKVYFKNPTGPNMLAFKDTNVELIKK